MTKLSDLYYAGGANAIAQPIIKDYDASGLVLRDGTGALSNFTMDEVTAQRIGGFLKVQWKGSFSAAPSGSGNWNIDIGSMGVTLDETRLGAGAAYSIKLGNILARDGGATIYGVASYTGSNFMQFLVQHDSPFSGAAWSQSYGSFTSGDTVSGELYFPVVGWTETEAVTTMTDAELTARVQPATATETGAVKKNKYTNLSYSNFTTGGTRAHTISGIEAGALYRVTVKADLVRSSNAGAYTRCRVWNNNSASGDIVTYLALDNNISTSTNEDFHGSSSSAIFAATTTALYLRFEAANGNCHVNGPSVVIEKIENYEEDTGVTST